VQLVKFVGNFRNGYVLNTVGDLDGLSALIVDDDLVYLEMVEGMLGMLGITKVVRADSGENAILAMRSETHVTDCVICDCRMSRGNGLQLLQAIRLGRVKNLRPDSCFILLTSEGDKEIVKTAQQLDVSGYLVKPVSVEKLREALTKARTRYFALDFKKYAAVPVPDLA
jgi:DNA-binding NarL/FixJ family response regulator